MQRPRLVLAAALAGALTLTCPPSTAGAQTRSAASRALTQAASGLGGRTALARLRTFRLQTSGRAFVFDEGLTPGNTVSTASTFAATVNMELRATADRLRVDSVRTSLGTPRRISEVLVGRRGFLSGVDSNGGSATTAAMTSDRWATTR